MNGLENEPCLSDCVSCSGCGSICCYDGVYVTPEEEERITGFVEANAEKFYWLDKPFIVDGDWPGMRSTRKTAVVPYDSYGSDFPKHLNKTRCVFSLPSGQCSLQRYATDLQMHPWSVKPVACWSFPIRTVHDGIIVPPPTDKDNDPDYIDEKYPGYVTFLPCVRRADEGGLSWTKKYYKEIEYIKLRGKDLK